MASNTLSERALAGVFNDYLELTKPGITLTVIASMLAGFLLGTGGIIDIPLLIHATIGTWLIASGTAAHNMYMERGYDGLMRRTGNRPLPANRILPRSGLLYSLTLIFSGLAWLLLLVNPVAGGVAFATTVIYLWAYTPLKRISALNVFVGAVPGALPVVGGWAAASGTIFEHGMWVLFGLIFCWQIPHVMSIAWVCRKDYEHAGFKMLPKRDPAGYVTIMWTLLPLVALLPTIWKLYIMGIAGPLFLSGALFMTAGFLWYGIRFGVKRDHHTARQLMFASFAYLPLIWALLFLDWILF
ncbi:MAG: heme o synthase [Balneolaceae bacterium]